MRFKHYVKRINDCIRLNRGIYFYSVPHKTAVRVLRYINKLSIRVPFEMYEDSCIIHGGLYDDEEF